MKFISLIIISIAIFYTNFALCFDQSESSKTTLTIYNSSFNKEKLLEFKDIAELFERKYNCKLNFVSLDNGSSLLSRLLLEGKSTKADIVFDLDINLLVQAEESGLFAEHKIDIGSLKIPSPWHSKYFLPYSYGYYSFVYDSEKIKNPPHSLDELVNSKSELKIIIQDPRSSSIGLGFLVWMKLIFGENSSDAWKKLSKKIITVTKSWSESYALFLKGECDLVLSYSTSPVYHINTEGKHNYKAISFTDGNFLHLEVTGKIANSKNSVLADQFLEFIISPQVQAYITKTDYVYPVIKLGNLLPKEYSYVAEPHISLFMQPEEIRKNKGLWVQEWLESFSTE